MLDKEKQDLSKYRVSTALDLLEVSKANIDIDTKSSVNRSYYAIYTAMRAVLALDGFDAKKHSGIISEFRKLYIKTGIFDVRFSVIIHDLFTIRNECDYEDFYIVSKEDAKTQLTNAEEFVNAINNYLTEKFN